MHGLPGGPGCGVRIAPNAPSPEKIMGVFACKKSILVTSPDVPAINAIIIQNSQQDTSFLCSGVIGSYPGESRMLKAPGFSGPEFSNTVLRTHAEPTAVLSTKGKRACSLRTDSGYR